MSSSPIRILLVDDHVVVREGLNALLSTPRFQISVVGSAADGVEAVTLAQQIQPDVILMDLQLPRIGGIEAIVAIKEDNPQACILVLTSFHETELAKEAIQAGAMGFLRKESTPDELVQAIRTVYQGRVSLPAELAQQLWQNAPTTPAGDETAVHLTGREKSILDGVVRGLSNKEIAAELNISPNTVRSHVRAILTKLDVSNRTQAAMYAVEHGLLET